MGFTEYSVQFLGCIDHGAALQRSKLTENAMVQSGCSSFVQSLSECVSFLDLD